MLKEWVNALAGGGLIGIAVSLRLLASGRVTGISGIVYGTLEKVSSEWLERVYFLVGLLFGGAVLFVLHPSFFGTGTSSSVGSLIFAGFLVGFGTVLGSGCTSGHGVCGNSRLSPRSLLATAIFILSGILTVFLAKLVRGEL